MRRALYEALQGTPLHAAVLDRSTFTHLGTVPEYLHHLCADAELAAALRLTHRAAVAAVAPTALATATIDAAATLMAVLVHEHVTVEGPAVVELSTLGPHTRVAHGCVLR